MKIFRPLDFLIILFVLALGIFLTVKKASHSSAKVHVHTEDSEYEYSAKANGIYEVQGTLGKTRFEIKDGRIRIIDSPCPNKICIHQGWDSPLVCLPNNVIITLEEEGENEFDAFAD